VNVQQDDLVLTGVFGPDGIEDGADTYAFSNFFTETGPTGQFQAVWTLTTPMDIDKLLIRLDGTTANAVTNLSGVNLDGDWTDGASTFDSGDGTPGGDFTFRFNVLPGDVDQSGTVGGGDLSVLLGSWLSPVPPASPFTDFDGDLTVGAADLSVLLGNWLQGLPASEPASATGAPDAESAGAASTAAVSTGRATSALARDAMAVIHHVRSNNLADRGGNERRFDGSSDDADGHTAPERKTRFVSSTRRASLLRRDRALGWRLGWAMQEHALNKDRFDLWSDHDPSNGVELKMQAPSRVWHRP
jgi:hypothetical protein